MARISKIHREVCLSRLTYYNVYRARVSGTPYRGDMWVHWVVDLEDKAPHVGQAIWIDKDGLAYPANAFEILQYRRRQIIFDDQNVTL